MIPFNTEMSQIFCKINLTLQKQQVTLISKTQTGSDTRKNLRTDTLCQGSNQPANLSFLLRAYDVWPKETMSILLYLQD